MLSPADLHAIRSLIEEILAKNDAPLFTVREAATFLKISERTLRNRIGPRASNPFPVQPIRNDHGPLRFKRADLERYVAAMGE
jgi:Helix-turn-helix domain